MDTFLKIVITAISLFTGSSDVVFAGDVTLGPQAERAYQQYLDRVGSRDGYFYASNSGAAGYSICPSHRCTNNLTMRQSAQRACEKHSDGAECILYARGRNRVD